jgi:hypothetical protein
MVSKRPVVGSVREAVTSSRFRRLYRLVQLLAEAPQTRQALSRRLRVDIRKFYRDLEFLRSFGVGVGIQEGRYSLLGSVAAAHDRLPFPDPLLSLGQMRQLARGRQAAHRQLRERLDELGT